MKKPEPKNPSAESMHSSVTTTETPKKHKKKGILIAIIIIIILAIGGAILTWYFMNRQLATQKKQQDSQIADLNKKAQDLQATLDKANETKDWISVTDPYEGMTFKYPKEWKITTIKETSPSLNENWKGPFQTTKLTSPSGFVLTLNSHISGLGGGCDPASCPQNNILSFDQVSKLKNGNPLYLMKLEVKDSADTKLLSRSIGLYAPSGQYELDHPYKVGKFQGFPPYVLFPGQGVDQGANSSGTQFVGPRSLLASSQATPDYQAKLTADEYFAQPDLVTAAKILSTVSF